MRADAYLAVAPGHMYIKHLTEEGEWVNVELTTGCFSRDEWYIQSTGVTTEAIRNGVFLTAMSPKEDIAYMMFTLAIAYRRIYKDYDYFTLLCGEKILESLPDNCSALELIIATRLQWGYDYIQHFGEDNSFFWGGQPCKVLCSK